MRKKTVFLIVTSSLLFLSLMLHTPIGSQLNPLIIKTVEANPKTIIARTNFTKIQEAINNASDGDIILVEAGTYYEHVVVNKTVSLIGENRGTTIIDGSGTGTVVKVTADNVNVTGFTIQNGGNQIADCGIFIGNWTGNTISNNTIRENYDGLRLLSSKSNKIVGNIIIDDVVGIWFSDSSNNQIIGNTITNNPTGVFVSSLTSQLNVFYHNNFINNTNQVRDFGNSKWDNEDIKRGNFWSDYVGNDTDSDGIGDTSYIEWGIIDRYPLMNPYEDIADPVADAGPDQLAFQGMTVTFDGSRSLDDTGIKSYVWSFIDGTLKTLYGVRPTYRFKNVGNFTVTLNVTDYADKWAVDTMWVNVSADNTEPSIGAISQEPEVPNDGEKVTISVGVTDEESGVHNVTLWYSTNGGAAWTDVPMNKTTGDTYAGEIPGFSAGTNVTYKITAYDNAENFAVDDNAGRYYVYTVIPEFPVDIVLPLFIIATLVAAVLRKRKRTSES